MSTVPCAASRPGDNEIDRLRDQAKNLRTSEVVRLFRALFARLNRCTQDGGDPRIYADRVGPARRYSSAYF